MQNLPNEQLFDIPASVAPVLFGEHNNNIAYLEKITGAVIADRGNHLTVNGEAKTLHQVEYIIQSLSEKIEKGKKVIEQGDIDAALRFWRRDHAIEEEFHEQTTGGKSTYNANISIKTRKKTIEPRSPNQEDYMRAIRSHDMIFGMGPAGTGKTYLAVAEGVSMYLDGKVERLIFTRPAVEAGESLGFLPGDMREKVDPYLRPIYDALNDMLPQDFILKKMEAGDIEVAPLAFMRGRTLSHAFVILDEAQNTTRTQMKMFLTRMGEATRMVITGDMTQTDLPRGQVSGLRDAVETLDGIPEISFHYFSSADVVRHSLVSKIVHAYEGRHANKQDDA